MNNTSVYQRVTRPTEVYLQWIDAGGFFRRPIAWLFYLIGTLVLLGTLGSIFKVYESLEYVGELFERDRSGYAVRLIIFFLAMSITLLGAGIFCATIWWKRARHINRDLRSGDEYTATPLVAVLVQTVAETIGAWAGVVGAMGTILAFLLTWSDDPGSMTIPVLNEFRDLRHVGLAGVVAFPIIGWVVVLVGKWLCEVLKGLSSIANNTRSLRSMHEEGVIEVEFGDDDVIALDYSRS